jgi:hypothetical protein
MNGVWRNIWPNTVTDIHGFDHEETDNFDMAKTVGFEDADEANVKNCFSSTQRSSAIDTSLSIRDDKDANSERSAKVTRVIEAAVACYKALYRERQKAAHQLSLLHFLRKLKVAKSTGAAR